MSCLLKYRWVKLPRALVPSGKGILGSWARLAARAAFRAGTGRYCGHLNDVTPGMDILVTKWIGIEGTSIIAKERKEELCGHFPRQLVETAGRLDQYLSVLPEAAVAVKSGVAAMRCGYSTSCKRSGTSPTRSIPQRRSWSTASATGYSNAPARDAQTAQSMSRTAMASSACRGI